MITRVPAAQTCMWVIWIRPHCCNNGLSCTRIDNKLLVFRKSVINLHAERCNSRPDSQLISSNHSINVLHRPLWWELFNGTRVRPCNWWHWVNWVRMLDHVPVEKRDRFEVIEMLLEVFRNLLGSLASLRALPFAHVRHDC